MTHHTGAAPARDTTVDDEVLDDLQRDAFEYFTHECNTAKGLVVDKTREDWPASIAATGLGLSAYPVGVERGFMTRDEAIKRTLTTLRFFWDGPQGPGRNSLGYRGFYYHFLGMKTGQRAWRSELSTMDTAILLAGALLAAQYFDRETKEEAEIRSLADQLYRRVDWPWALNDGATLVHGWKPKMGFLPYRWQGYDEALLLYILALGSPTHPLPEESYHAMTEEYVWKTIYGYEFLFAGPLFIHQYPQLWIDFRGLQDDFMRAHGSDYFENSRRATYVQRDYAIRNPFEFEGYSENCWGITASDGPGPMMAEVKEVLRLFFDYVARGVPYGPDDGTIAPWAAVASLPFAPEIVLPVIAYLNQLHLAENVYGYKATVNFTYPHKSENEFGWVSPYHYGLNQGPIVLMIENYRTELPWRLMRQCPYITAGLRRAGFAGGWL